MQYTVRIYTKGQKVIIVQYTYIPTRRQSKFSLSKYTLYSVGGRTLGKPLQPNKAIWNIRKKHSSACSILTAYIYSLARIRRPYQASPLRFSHPITRTAAAAATTALSYKSECHIVTTRSKTTATSCYTLKMAALSLSLGNHQTKLSRFSHASRDRALVYICTHARALSNSEMKSLFFVRSL